MKLYSFDHDLIIKIKLKNAIYYYRKISREKNELSFAVTHTSSNSVTDLNPFNHTNH